MPSLISHPTPSAASLPIWHPLLSGERANMQFTPLHILTTFTDAGWSTELFNQDTDSSASSRTQNWRSTDKHFIKPVCPFWLCRMAVVMLVVLAFLSSFLQISLLLFSPPPSLCLLKMKNHTGFTISSTDCVTLYTPCCKSALNSLPDHAVLALALCLWTI